MFSRLKAAQQRYGWRAFLILLYRIFLDWQRLRSTLVVLKLKCLLKSTIGANVCFGRGISIAIPGGILEIGSHTAFADRCVISISANPMARMKVGSNCYFANDVVLCANKRLEIGDNVRIAEFTSIRDSSHEYKDRHRHINHQGDVRGKIIIKNDVWIGQGCILLGSTEGVIIGEGAVIGAHSVVKKSIPDYAIAVGAPAQIIGFRN